MQGVDKEISDRLAAAVEARLNAAGLVKEAAAERRSAAEEMTKAKILREEADRLAAELRSEAAREQRRHEREVELLRIRTDAESKARAEAREERSSRWDMAREAIASLATLASKAGAVEAVAAAAGGGEAPRGLWADIKGFAKAHPFLTAALVVLAIVAIGFVAVTAYDWAFGGAPAEGALDAATLSVAARGGGGR